jgi:cell division protein FtsB
MVLASIAASAVWGESGVLARHALRARLERANDDLAALDRENQRLLRDLSVMEQDPVVLERIIAEELGWAREGSTVYRFEPAAEAASTPPGTAAP